MTTIFLFINLLFNVQLQVLLFHLNSHIEQIIERLNLMNSINIWILLIPATLSGTERLFSHAGIILNNRRQRLSLNQVDNMLVIRSARQILSNMKRDDLKN